MRSLFFIISFCLISLLVFQSYRQVDKTEADPIFSTLSPQESGIDFNNSLTVTDQMNFFEYGYFYLGGGVAVGDFNKDQKQDIYFTGNMVPNKLYLNKGNLQFQDITQSAGVAADDRWVTGCAVVDINADGWDDLYVSVAGKWKSRKNILYINKGLDENGIPVFEDMAEKYGLDDEGYSIQATFLDYDNDGDLDVFVVNYPPTPFNYTTRNYKRLMDNVKWNQSDHLYRNNGNNTFTDVTEEAQLLAYGLSLGVIANDFNQDGYTDLYVSNDFHTPDLFYLNNGDGTFKEVSQKSLQHTAFYGMGVDAADYNNDGLLDFMQLDMAPVDNFRSKANMASMDPTRFWDMVDNGFHFQYMYNTVQTSMGVRENGLPFYAETAKLSGLDKTDWSWACLFADLDNDGFKDIFVTNGIRRDINNKDYFSWLARMEKGNKIKELSLPELIEKMPAKKLDNPVFKNVEGKTFLRSNEEWGIHYEGFSNGATYADLDNDGDLELIINNIDSTAAVFKNLTVENKVNNYLGIQLHGPASNPNGLGAKISLTCSSMTQYHEHTTVRGYQSSVDQKLHFGLGKSSVVDEIRITWPDGNQQLLTDIKPNQVIQVNHLQSKKAKPSVNTKAPLFQEAPPEAAPNFVHQENEFDDYQREVLLPHKMSAFGPALATGDVNNDGLDDVFAGGAKGQSPCLLLSTSEGADYRHCISLPGESHEDVDALFFDADGDEDLDLYVVSGGNEEIAGHAFYQDRIYENDGEGNFSLLADAISCQAVSGSVVINVDYDGDGDEDLFVGSRQVPGQYPRPATSYILENVSTSSGIQFQALAQNEAPGLVELGMVTDAVWDDFDGDNDFDLIIVGEWMPVTFIENHNNLFKKRDMPDFNTQTTGWWNTIEKADFDKDGDNDYVLGNLGLNYKYKASKEASFDVYADDFDENGKPDIVLGYYQEGIQFPVRGKQCSAQQIPDIKKRFSSYNTFANSNLNQIYSPIKLQKSLHYQVREFAHIYIENRGNGSFAYRALPLSTQIGTINAIEVFDFNNDGNLDLVMGGNLMNAEVETPRSDACFGWLLLGDGKGDFKHQDFAASGLDVPYETRKIAVINPKTNPMLIFARNNKPLRVYKF